MTANRVQNYNKILNFKKKIEISGYHLLIFLIKQRELCAKMAITPGYIKHLPMFKEFLDLQKVYEKKTYIYARLGEKYFMHPSSVRKVITRLLHVIQLGA